jgi:serine/threonine-protein kinase RsbT
MTMDFETISSQHRSSPPRGFLPVAFHRTISRVLLDYFSVLRAQAVLAAVEGATGTPLERLTQSHVPRLVIEAERALDLFPVDPARRTACLQRLRRLGAHSAAEPFTTASANEVVFVIRIEQEVDIVRARLAAGDACRELGFSGMKCTKVSTAVSELSRNIFHYAGAGHISITPFEGDHAGVEVTARDEGPGIENIDIVLSDRYRSARGTGAGLKAIRLLMDSFEIESSAGAGTTVVVRKLKG